MNRVTVQGEERMKEILIYGALVAAVMGAAIPIITNFTSTVTTQSSAMNTALTNKAQALVKAIG